MTEITDKLKPRLLFKHPGFHEGLNVTVRYGSKWGGRVGPEEIVEVHEAEPRPGCSSYLFDAFIVDVQAMKICDIPDEVLALEHTPECRRHVGLMHELARVYRKRINPRDTVTVIVFEQCDPDPGEHDDPIEPPRIN